MTQPSKYTVQQNNKKYIINYKIKVARDHGVCNYAEIKIAFAVNVV